MARTLTIPPPRPIAKATAPPRAPTAATAPPRPPGNPARPMLSTHLVLVDPRMAQRLLTTDATFPQQRPLRPRHVAYLAWVIARGRFRPGTTITLARIGKQGPRFLINGRHTLTALSETTGAPIWLQIEEHQVPTLEDVAWLYQTYDTGMPRSLPDLYRADPGLLAHHFPPTAIRQLAGASTHLAWGFTRSRSHAHALHLHALLRDIRVKIALMESWHAELALVRQDLDRKPRSVTKYLDRAAVMAIMLVTYRYAPAQAQQFWPRLASDSGLVSGDPAHTLLRWLRDTDAHQLRLDDYPRYPAAAWNAFVAHKTLGRMRADEGSVPLTLAGTPHQGKAHLAYVAQDGTVLRDPAPWQDG
jgi:hypothetical protein